MTKQEALRIVSRYQPCPHDNADVRLGDGKTWANCEDCGHSFPQRNWQRAKDASAEFEAAIDVLTNSGE